MTSATLGVVGLGSMGPGGALSALRRGVPTRGCDPRPDAGVPGVELPTKGSA